MELERPQILGLNERPPSTEIARKIIDYIRSDRGHIDTTDEFEISKTSIEWQGIFRQRQQRLREVSARYTKTVSDQLYTSKYRFIYEILQNADDAEYDLGVKPTITIRVRSNELTIETNELGFNHANVQAICATGESSKLKTINTTGEKGLGFKSVFGIANRVHIQSGNWSFRFEYPPSYNHPPAESGLGMITPIWTTDASVLPTGVGTKITLSYTDTDTASVRKLVSEFDKVHETVVFALRKLQKVTIDFDNVLDRTWKRTVEKSYDVGLGDLCIVDSRMGLSMNQVSRLNFTEFSTKLMHLPIDDLRRADDNEVRIAFQLDPVTRKPVIPERGQYVFAFLPIQRLSQLPFLIHANFILAANREAVPEGDWNLALREGIARAFNAAVLSMVRDTGHPLRFEWLRYLPTVHIEGFWEPLSESIKTQLAESPVLQSRKHSRMQKPKCLREIPPVFMHGNEPLLPDLLLEDVYISANYSPLHLPILNELGLQRLSMLEMVDRLSEDLKSPQSILRTWPLEDTWHKSLRRLVTHVSSDWVQRSRIRQLNIIPLADGSWTYADNPVPIYFPVMVQKDSVCIQIPENIGLSKLHLSCCRDKESEAFYSIQGVTNISHPTIIQKILAAQKGGTTSDFSFLETMLNHLEILFWFGEKPREPLWASDQQKYMRRTSKLYFPSSDPFDAQSLLGVRSWTEIPNFGLLSTVYLDSQVKGSVQHGSTWLQWLEKFAKVRYFPPLAYFASASLGWKLDPILKLVAEDDPIKFMSNLKVHWSDYRVECFDSVVDEIKKIQVICLNSMAKSLADTLLPTQSALFEARKYGVENDMPFLKLENGDLTVEDRSWDFLSNFGVCCATDRRFYIEILTHLSEGQTPSQTLLPRVIALYTRIGEISSVGEAKQLQDIFGASNYIYIPSPVDLWVSLGRCVWRGPTVLRSMFVLESVYGQYAEIEALFANLLSIPDATYHHVVTDLQNTKTGLTGYDDHNPDELYIVLDQMLQGIQDCVDLRQIFESESLIKVQSGWIKPSSGIWNCSVELSGRVPLEPLYPSLRSFFVQKLSIKIMNPVLLLEELAKVALRGSTNYDLTVLNEVKSIMIPTGQILAADRDDEKLKGPLEALRRLAFLPARGPKGHSLQKTSAEVFIVDHERFGEAFRGKIRLLDFAWTAMPSLHPLFKLLKLEGRYLSRHVEAETTVGSSEFNSEFTNHFRNRAYALSCCAVAHQSALYLSESNKRHGILLDAEVYISETMNTKLIVMIDQGQTEIEAESDRSLVKVDLLEQGLKIYVPSDASGLYSCYRNELPAELMKILGIEHPGATKQVYRILNEDVVGLDAIMFEEDIPRVAWLRQDQLPESAFTDARPVTPHATITTSAGEVLVVQRHSTGGLYPLTLPPSVSPGGTFARVLLNNAYKKLLEHVVKRARRIPERYRDGTFSMAALTESLSTDTTPSYNFTTLQQAISTDPQSGEFFEIGNKRVGAAGELFVFELLKALRMPSFTLYNWQSNIRAEVRHLDNYQKLNNWEGLEIADIMYASNSVAMKDFLRKHSYNGLPHWINDTDQIQYLIEVKATTGPCTTPFLVSKHQFQLMRQHALAGQEQQAQELVKTVYVIMRVYNLLRDIRLEMYVDPWALKDNTLEFVADPWKVISPAPRSL